MSNYTADFIANLPAEMRKEVAMLSADIEKLKKERHEQGLALNVKKEEAALVKLKADQAKLIETTNAEAAKILTDANAEADALVDKTMENTRAMKATADKHVREALEIKDAANKKTALLDERETKLDEREKMMLVAEKSLARKSELMYERAQAAIRALNEI